MKAIKVPQSGDDAAAILFREQLTNLAHALWEDRGCPEGTPEQDWYQAERVLVAKK